MPGQPALTITGLGPTWFNVTFTPSQQGVAGSVFYVQYKKTIRSNWDQSKEESVQRTLQVTGLEPAIYYDVRVVAMNGAFLQTPSGTVVVYTDPTGLQYLLNSIYIQVHLRYEVSVKFMYKYYFIDAYIINVEGSRILNNDKRSRNHITMNNLGTTCRSSAVELRQLRVAPYSGPHSGRADCHSRCAVLLQG